MTKIKELKEEIKQLIDDCYSMNILDFILYVLKHWNTNN